VTVCETQGSIERFLLFGGVKVDSWDISLGKPVEQGLNDGSGQTTPGLGGVRGRPLDATKAGFEMKTREQLRPD
jgi:hypothetical protein